MKTLITWDVLLSIVNTPLWGLGLKTASSLKWEIFKVSSILDWLSGWKELCVAWVLKLTLFISSVLSNALLNCTLETDLSFLVSLGKLWLNSNEELAVGVSPRSLARSNLPFLWKIKIQLKINKVCNHSTRIEGCMQSFKMVKRTGGDL